MPTNRYWGEDATLSVKIAGGAAITVGKARNASARAEAEHVELYTPDSIKRQEVKRREAVMIVEMEYIEFDEEFAQLWLAGDSSGAGSTTLTDTSDVALFDVEIEMPMTDHDGAVGAESIKAVVSNVHFAEMPLASLAQGEYIAHNVTGRGDGVTLTKEVVSA